MVDQQQMTVDEAISQFSPSSTQTQPQLPSETEGQPLTADQAIEKFKPSLISQAANVAGLAGKAIGSTATDFMGFTDSGEKARAQFLNNTSIGRIMQAAGMGFSEPFKEPLGVQPGSDTENNLKKFGLMDDVSKGEQTFWQAFKSSLGVEAANAAYGATVGIRSIFGGIGAALGQTEDETGVPLGDIMNVAAAEGVPLEIPQGVMRARILPKPFADAKSAGVLESEAVNSGVAEPTVEQSVAMHNAAADVTPPAPEPAPEPAKLPDIHEAARNIDPETFEKYDRLAEKQDDLRAQIQDLRDKRADEFSGNEKQLPQVDDELATLKNNADAILNGKSEESLSAKKSAQLETIRSQIDDLNKLRDHLAGVDTPEMAGLRQKIQELDIQRRDLAPQVSEAYRKAQEGLPHVETVSETAEQPKIMPPPEAVPQDLKPANVSGSAQPVPSELRNPDMINRIVADATENIKSAGRPEEEAGAAAKLIAEHYAARAERFGGKKGTAEEMYKRDMATIKAGRERSRVLAQNKGRDLNQFETLEDEAYAQKQGHLANLEAQISNETNADKLADLKREKDLTEKWLDDHARELNQASRGKIRLATDDAKNAITLMKNANASTFIHEVGHHWLDELMRDSKDVDAPSDLIKDYDAVRKWLGSKDGEEISTKQHEKFARGFERYLMEGVSPSKELAGVFAKFKQWLTQIYKTVASLNSPINDDIRDVFDRLLSKNPEKTIIAPEHEIGGMMANIHSADAEHTPPQHAAEVADNMREEIDRMAKTHDMEAYNAIKSSENGSSTVEASGGQPTATAEPIAPAAEPAQVGTSGGQASTESAGLRNAKQSERPAAGSTGSAEVFGRPKSDLIDKAGNIRLDNLNAPEDVAEVIRQTALDNQDFAAARGVVSDDQVMRLADALGVKASEVNLAKISDIMGPGQLASKIMAARKLLVQSATELRDAMSKAATGSDDDVMAYAEAKERHIMIEQQISGVTAEAGRALRAFRSIEGGAEAKAVGDFLKQATGKDLFQLKEEAKLGASLDTPEKVSKFIQDSKKPSFGDMLLEYLINGLVSGPATHTTYGIGNTLLGLWKAIPETTVASLLGKIRGEESVKLGEVGSQLKGAYEALPSAVSAAAKAAKTGLTTLLPEEKLSAQTFGGKGIPAQIGNETATWRDAGADAFAAVKGVRDAFIATGDLTQTGAIPDFALKGIKVPLGTIIRAPQRAIAAIHSFFRTVNYSMEKSAIAYRTAVDEGLSGNDFDARVADIVTNPNEAVMNQARSLLKVR